MNEFNDSDGGDNPSTGDATVDAIPESEITLQFPEGTPQETVEIIARSIKTSFSGPLPPPDMLKKYEEVLPGSADRIVSLAENEQKIQGRITKNIARNDSLRVYGSIVVSGLLVAGAVFCAYIGEPWVGGLLGTSGIIPSILKAFVKPNEKDGPE